ncbi:VOC family protein [Thermaerobacter litoralis]
MPPGDPDHPLPAGLRLGPVYLRVRQLARVMPFYRDLLGLVPTAFPAAGGVAAGGIDGGTDGLTGATMPPAARDAGTPEPDDPAAPPAAPGTGRRVVALGAASGRPPLLVLEEVPAAPIRPPRTTGLYHIALLYPSRAALGRAFLRLVEGGWRFQGFADHGVSEALYLADPEGNGLELYADRPRDQWPRGHDGSVAMYTAPLDLESLVAAARDDLRSPAAPEPPQPADPGSPDHPSAGAPAEPDGLGPVVGHVHLQVSRLETAEAFYCGVLGFEVTQRDFPGALFVAAGGYHHHLGLNVWAGEGAPAPPPGAAGLAGFTVVLPTAADLAAVRERVQRARLPLQATERGWTVIDPDRIPVHLTT